jgi:hypothetical protein
MLRSVRTHVSCLLSMVLLAGKPTAQVSPQPRSEATPATRTVCDMPGLVVPFFQGDDGRVPASWARTGAPSEAGVVDADLCTTALAALAILADGSTLRSGPHREFLKGTIAWLSAQQTDAGRFVRRDDAEGWLEDAIATHAIVEAGRLSDWFALAPHFERATSALTDRLRTSGAEVGPELLLWCRLSVLSGREFEIQCAQRIARTAKFVDVPLLDFGVEALDAEVRRCASQLDPTTDRARAARYLFEVLDGATPDPGLLDALRPVFVRDERALDDVDPLALLYAATASHAEGGSTWQGLAPLVKDVLDAARPVDGALHLTWAPRGPFGARHGRNGMTAARRLVSGVYYRSSSLLMSRR